MSLVTSTYTIPAAFVRTEFLRMHGFSMELEPFAPDEFGVAVIFQVVLAWFKTGKAENIVRADGKNYPGVLMEHEVPFFTVPGHENPVISLPTKTADIVYLTMIEKPADEFAMIATARQCMATRRDYRAVAKVDVDTLATELKRVLSQQIAAAFLLRPGEALQTSNCMCGVSSNHRIGDEADTVKVTVAHTCQGVAYDQQGLARKATDIFKALGTPGPHFVLVGAVQASIIDVSPLLVRCRGIWAYILTQSYRHDLAAAIAGDTPVQAKAYLLL